MAGAVLVALLGIWVLVQGLNGNAGRLVTGEIGLSTSGGGPGTEGPAPTAPSSPSTGPGAEAPAAPNAAGGGGSLVAP